MEKNAPDKRHQAVYAFMQTDKMHRKLCEKKIGGLGIHRSQHIMLMVLSHFDRSVTQKEISEKLKISAAAAAVSLRKLEAAGFIERASSGGDKRCNEVKITEKGEEIVRKSKEIFESIDSVMTMGVSEAELDTFIGIVGKMEANLLTKIREAENEKVE